MKNLELEGKLKITFEAAVVPPEDLPPAAVPDAVPAAAPPPGAVLAQAPPPPGPEEVLDAVRNILERHQEENAVRLEDGLGLLSRRFEGELRHLHQRLDHPDDGAGGSRKRVKYDLLQGEDLKKE